MKTAVFPGSFDPFTLGHYDLVRRALPLFDRIIIGIGNNSEKKYMFPLEERKERIREAFEGTSQVEVMEYTGLTAEFCEKQKAGFILRGIRSVGDYNFEAPIAAMNRRIGNSPETVFLLSAPEHSAISSTILREILRNGGDISPFIP